MSFTRTEQTMFVPMSYKVRCRAPTDDDNWQLQLSDNGNQTVNEVVKIQQAASELDHCQVRMFFVSR